MNDRLMIFNEPYSILVSLLFLPAAFAALRVFRAFARLSLPKRDLTELTDGAGFGTVAFGLNLGCRV